VIKMAKKVTFRGYTPEQLKEMSLTDFSKIITARERRALKRGFTEPQKKLLKKIKEQPDKFHKTHERNIVIIPQMLDAKLGVYNGKEWVTVEITPEKLGHRLGEFAMTRQRVKHSSPGVGASRSSKHVSIK
jgi:small subunit ribosomal protein S19